MSKITDNEWQVCKKSIKDRCEYLLTSQKWTDCSLVVGQKPNAETFRVHRLILGISSPVLEAMLLGELAEGQDSFSLPDIQPETFRVLLQYIYFDHFKLSDVNLAFDLCKVAKEYKLPDLVEQCSYVIQENITPAIACKTLEFAKLIDEPDLVKCSMKIIRNESEKVLADSSILDISMDTWHSILDCKLMQTENECTLLTSLYNWAIKECQRGKLSETRENMCSLVDSAVTKIRFLSLTAQEFVEAPEVPLLLSPETSNAILCNIVSLKSPYPIPQGYSVVTETRRSFKYICDIVYGFGNFWGPTQVRGFQSVLNLSVDRAIRIYGIVIEGNKNRGLTWGQLLNVEVRDCNGVKVASLGEGQEEIVDWTPSELLFNISFVIEPNQNYQIIIQFLLDGHLVTFSKIPLSPTWATCKGVTFKLSDGKEKRRIIKSILFSHA